MRDPQNNVDQICYAQFEKENEPYGKLSQNKEGLDEEGSDSKGDDAP